ncbi:unnamed protein product [Caenorhabditis auriculariae]|uniref:Uncharacterized protein n=1 Tax=Caenorhabditis auriculariae TaxID=2777116 RepID=A0A8S1H085_9PELO|nr:unnamed protein product [Caenorhabditis auriculariae]
MRSAILIILLLEAAYTWYLPGDYYYPDDPSTIGKPLDTGRKSQRPDGKENQAPRNYTGGFNQHRRPPYFYGEWFSDPFRDRTADYNAHINMHGTHHNLDRPINHNRTATTTQSPRPNWHGMNPQAGSHGWNDRSHFGNTNRGPPTPNNQGRTVLGDITRGGGNWNPSGRRGGGWNQGPFRGK